MKSFIQSINNRVKSVYLVWAGINLVMYIVSGNFLTFDNRFMTEYEAPEEIYPFGGGIKYYDYSDFILYLALPILIYFIYYYWNKRDIK